MTYTNIDYNHRTQSAPKRPIKKSTIVNAVKGVLGTLSGVVFLGVGCGLILLVG